MSNKDTSDDTSPAGEKDDQPEDLAPEPGSTAKAEPELETETGHETEPEPEPGPDTGDEAATVPPPVKRRGGFVAWLALILSLAAFAAVGYSTYQDWRAQSSADASLSSMTRSIDSVGERVDASSEALAVLDKDLAALGDALAGSASELAGLRRDFDDRIGLLESLPPRMSMLENSMASLQGVSKGARDTWLLAEAEYYMQIANAQLQLAGNPHLAALAMGMADERILQLANPALTDVRRAVSDELAALELMEKPDIEGVSLTLSSLARVVDALPLQQAERSAGGGGEVADEASSGVNRAWNSVKGAVSGLVRVTPPDQAVMPLISPEAEYFLRTNLTLQLQSARLALLRGEKAVFEASLDDAAAWMRQYFDTESAPVSGALQTISEIRDGMFTVAVPDISGSLRLLRQYKTLAETAQ